MGIFSRTRDIIAANVTDLLDKAEDPAKMIRMIIMEMEETLVEVRASRRAHDRRPEGDAAPDRASSSGCRTAGSRRPSSRFPRTARTSPRRPSFEKQKAADMADQLKAEIEVLDDALRASEADIAKLQNKLREARARQNAIMTRMESAQNRARLREMYAGPKVDDAFSRFDVLERHADLAEGQADALSLGAPPKTLDEEIAELRNADKVDAELEALKRAARPSAATAAKPRRRADRWKTSWFRNRHRRRSSFIGLPWLVFHYITKWKTAATLTSEDENLLDELHDLARRLDDRMCTIERIVQAENPELARARLRPGRDRARGPHRAHARSAAAPTARQEDLMTTARTPNSISTSRTANGRASAPASPTIPASTSPWSGSASCCAPCSVGGMTCCSPISSSPGWRRRSRVELYERGSRAEEVLAGRARVARAGPPATCARASATSTAGSPTSRPM